MKVFVPEISWHNRLPALSLDISNPTDELGNQYRIATGGNDCRVYIWLVSIDGQSTNPWIQIKAGLRRHQKSVGAVRFSPLAHMLASGDDDGYIYLWKHQVDQEKEQEHSIEPSNVFMNDDGFKDQELWQQQKVLRGHIEDICDLAWSKDGQYLLSGSVDNSAILWDTFKGIKIWCSDLIKGYVQGVAIDPHTQFMAALSSDRALRIYDFSEKRQLYATRCMNIQNKYKAFICDDTVKTFCRRLQFSPDGQFLLVPTSRLVERPPDEETSSQQPQVAKKYFQTLLVFKGPGFNKPSHFYPTGEVALCARFSPIIYQLRDIDTNFWGTPYRLIFAVATARSVILYDTQQPLPIGYISQIHLARLTDIAWSSDGRMLMASSYDGYITIVTFAHEEFGKIYTGPLINHSKKGEKRKASKEIAPKKEKLNQWWVDQFRKTSR